MVQGGGGGGAEGGNGVGFVLGDQLFFFMAEHGSSSFGYSFLQPQHGSGGVGAPVRVVLDLTHRGGLAINAHKSVWRGIQRVLM